MMPIAGHTTEVTVTRSLEQITKLLAKAKVRAIQTTYNVNGEPDGLTFAIGTEWGERTYALPIRASGVRATLRRDNVAPRYQTAEHANRVAWRIAHDWLRAQLALIDAGMVTLPEVLFPYLVLDYDDTEPITAFQQYAGRQAQLEGTP